MRSEQPGDESAIRAIHARAFQRVEDHDATPPEVWLVDELRASEAWLPRLSLVAPIDGRPVGHVVCTRAHVGAVPVLALGPIGVEPSMQCAGIGRELMQAVLAEADGLGEPLIGLVGSTSYYARFGFVAASSVGISPPEPAWGKHFQIRALSSYRADITGPFEYASPFVAL